MDEDEKGVSEDMANRGINVAINDVSNDVAEGSAGQVVFYNVTEKIGGPARDPGGGTVVHFLDVLLECGRLNERKERGVRRAARKRNRRGRRVKAPSFVFFARSRDVDKRRLKSTFNGTSKVATLKIATKCFTVGV